MNNSQKNTILLAENDEDARIMLCTFLERKDYKVIEAENGLEAIEAANLKHPDLILMDLNMPVLDGIGAAIEIRSQPELQEIPILAISASGRYGMEFFLNIGKLGKGYIDYLPKPFDLKSVAEHIETALLRTKNSAF